MKVLIILSLLAISIYNCSAYSADEICEWSQTASDEEKQQALEFIGPIFHQVYGEHRAEFEAAYGNDANLAAFGQTFQNPDLCEGARQAEQLFEQLNEESQALVSEVWGELGAAIEEAKGSK